MKDFVKATLINKLDFSSKSKPRKSPSGPRKGIEGQNMPQSTTRSWSQAVSIQPKSSPGNRYPTTEATGGAFFAKIDHHLGKIDEDLANYYKVLSGPENSFSEDGGQSADQNGYNVVEYRLKDCITPSIYFREPVRHFKTDLEQDFQKYQRERAEVAGDDSGREGKGDKQALADFGGIKLNERRDRKVRKKSESVSFLGVQDEFEYVLQAQRELNEVQILKREQEELEKHRNDKIGFSSISPKKSKNSANHGHSQALGSPQSDLFAIEEDAEAKEGDLTLDQVLDQRENFLKYCLWLKNPEGSGSDVASFQLFGKKLNLDIGFMTENMVLEDIGYLSPSLKVFYILSLH